MKILHISLGLPPFRTGGLNRYCLDLMTEQKKQGDAVILLYPGEFLPGGNTGIRKTAHPFFTLYRIVNPLPLPLTSGISAPQRYMRPCKNPACYRKFLQMVQPDVIHVHSFQGIHREFFLIARELGLKMVFTTHDYYPFCPSCVLLRGDGSVCPGPEGNQCAQCSRGRGLSALQEIVMQSRTYEKLKYCPAIKRLRAHQVKTMESAPTAEQFPAAAENGAQYDALRAYYRDILRCMDMLHANSAVAQKIYETYGPPVPCCQLGITHGGITPLTHKRREDGILRFGYVGGLSRYKGLPILLEAVQLFESQAPGPYELWLYGADYRDEAQANPNIRNGGVYDVQTEDAVWASFDILIVPSQWYETFGFVVLEALAHGVAVICSDLVGAKQLLTQNDIFCHDSAASLAAAMGRPHVSPAIPPALYSMEQHTRTVRERLYGI